MSRYWDGEWPNLNSVAVALDFRADALSLAEIGALYRLIWFCAAQRVHTSFSHPSPMPSLPRDPQRIARIVGCTLREWEQIAPAVLSFFKDDGSMWVLADDSLIRLSRPGRSPIPTAVSESVRERDGKRCVYCGDADGPFHLDHLWPVSQGGDNRPENLVVACAPCKGGKSLREWMESRDE